jgi:hypothetical protein
MATLSQTHGRRAVLRRLGNLGIGLTALPLLAGCGGGDTTSTSGDVNAHADPAPTLVPALTITAVRLNLALNLGYVGAQYYAWASGGSGLSPTSTSGVGRQGWATGARIAALSDSRIAAAASEIATVKLDTVVALRQQLGSAAAAAPVLDLSSTSGGAFGAVADAGGLASSVSFDPYSGDSDFLVGAFMIENGFAAALRGVATTVGDTMPSDVLDDAIVRATYHGALVRTLLEEKAADDSALSDTLSRLCEAASRFDGTDTGDQAITNDAGMSANLVDAAGRPIPFVRTPNQALRTIVLGVRSSGGFLPYGANGLA